MLPKWHILTGAILASIMYIAGFSLVNCIVFFLASFLIDVDHYSYYVYRKKDWSLKNAFKWHLALEKEYMKMPIGKRTKYHYGICILHGIEPILIIFFLSLLFKPLVFIALGFIVHIALDVIHRLFNNEDPLEITSLIYKLFYDRKRIDLEPLVKSWK